MNRFSLAVSVVAAAAALYVGQFSVGPVPPLGNFLDPAHGVWAVASVAELPPTDARQLSGLGANVEVKYDDRGVPHIFAETELDAYRALGWVHARDRLFQMELTQRAVAGTLTELVGARALPADRESRRLGLARAAEAKWASIADGSEVRLAVTSYMDGVNAYVAAMRPADLPIEYRLLGRTPRRFEPEDTYYLLARMSQTLSYQESELRTAAVEQLIGRAATDALFPIDAPIQEPIEPVPGRTQARIINRPIPAPELATPPRIAMARKYLDAAPLFERGEAVVGSNNWAVAPQRTAAGFALLAGDPHLQLTLPSIWYEAHLVVRGGIDVYGVTIPLSPIVPIGFNKDVAWTATNTGNDVVDFYREIVDDSISPTKYSLDGEWKDVSRYVEVYRNPRGGVVAEDTMFATHRGPMYQTSLGWLSVRWTARELSDEGDAFRRAMRTGSVADWYAAMEDYRTPAQNFLVADRSGTIGIRSTGRYPIRPGDGRGDVIFDGSSTANDWIGDQPLAWYPQARAPRQGYIASANQQPMDPVSRRGYQGSEWPSPWRAMRINNLLRGNPRMTPDLMRQFQTDPKSELTGFVMTAVGDAMIAAQRSGTWTADDESAFGLLSKWDGAFAPDANGAVLFDALVQALTRKTWDELVLTGEDRRVATPGQMILVRLLAEPSNVWWDDRSTDDVRENRDAIVLASLREAWSTTKARFGDNHLEWKWRQVRVARVHHLLRLPGFGRDSLVLSSGPGTLAPSDAGGTHGASWRFVVELGPTVRAWGTYPGGQSGNPLSSRYDDRLELWRTGQLAELRVPRAATELAADRTSAVLTLRPE